MVAAAYGVIKTVVEVECYSVLLRRFNQGILISFIFLGHGCM